MVALRRVVRTPEGFSVDPETGEVLDEVSVDVEHPEYRVFDGQDLARKVHYEPMRVERPQIVALGDTPFSRYSYELVEKALELAGALGVSLFKCLVNMGCDSYTALYAVERLHSGGGSGRWVRLAKAIASAVDGALANALIRWVTYPSKPINALSSLSGRYVRTRYGAAVITSIDGVGVQIMPRKIDLSARLGQSVYGALDRLRRVLGVELSPPRPVVATIVLRPPFTVSLEAAALLGVRQRYRVKLERSFYTALVFRSVTNIYAKLEGSLERARYALLDLLPILCLCANR